MQKETITPLTVYIYCLSTHHIGVGDLIPSTKFVTSRCSLWDILRSLGVLVKPTYASSHCSVIPEGDTYPLNSDCESLSWLRSCCGRRCSNSCQHQIFFYCFLQASDYVSYLGMFALWLILQMCCRIICDLYNDTRTFISPYSSECGYSSHTPALYSVQ